MYSDRIKLYQKLEKEYDSRLLVYITGDRPGMETKIHSEVLNLIIEHLDSFKSPKKVSLFLYSRGGDTLAGWSIVNLIRQFSKEFEVIIPFKAHSTATLISIGADRIIMTKQATLSPIDPSITTPLNPQIPGAPPQQRLPVSVEAIAGYFDLAKDMAGLKDVDLLKVFEKLTDHVHPIALGNVYRARTQIQRLADKLLQYHMSDPEKIDKVIKFLCSESGSHDYTINRSEAKNDLGLPIEKPNDEQYDTIRDIFNDIKRELELESRFEPAIVLGSESEKPYTTTRANIESLTGGSHSYKTSGLIRKQKVQAPQGLTDAVMFQITSEGWKYEKI